jgi:hypothetical protein
MLTSLLFAYLVTGTMAVTVGVFRSGPREPDTIRTVSEPQVPRETGDEISPEGAIAAKTLVAVLVVSGVAIVAASWNELWHPCGVVVSTCVNRASTAALLDLFSIGAIAVAVALGWRLRSRLVRPEGSSRYVIALGVLFALGLVSLAASIPTFTCARGRLDLFLEMCLHPQTRSDATSWLLLKRGILLFGLVGGVAMAFSRRGVKVSAPLAALGWFGGVVGFLVATKMVHLA